MCSVYLLYAKSELGALCTVTYGEAEKGRPVGERPHRHRPHLHRLRQGRQRLDRLQRVYPCHLLHGTEDPLSKYL